MLLPSSSVFRQAEEQIFRLPSVGIMKQSSTYKTDIFLDLCVFEPAPPVVHRNNASENIKQNYLCITVTVTGHVNNQLERENSALA